MDFMVNKFKYYQSLFKEMIEITPLSIQMGNGY